MLQIIKRQWKVLLDCTLKQLSKNPLACGYADVMWALMPRRVDEIIPSRLIVPIQIAYLGHTKC